MNFLGVFLVLGALLALAPAFESECNKYGDDEMAVLASNDTFVKDLVLHMRTLEAGDIYDYRGCGCTVYDASIMTFSTVLQHFDTNAHQDILALVWENVKKGCCALSIMPAIKNYYRLKVYFHHAIEDIPDISFDMPWEEFRQTARMIRRFSDDRGPDVNETEVASRIERNGLDIEGRTLCIQNIANEIYSRFRKLVFQEDQ